MIVARARIGGREQLVRVEGDTLHLLDGDLFASRETGRTAARSDATFVAPLRPGKVVCVGRNYRAHAKELGNEVPTEPLLFIKPQTAVIGPHEAILLPRQSQRVEHEGELAVLIGTRLHDGTPGQAREAIFGYLCANDVTARDLQKQDVQFTRGKGFDTFCPLGPWVTTERPGPDAAVTVRVNGTQRQRGFFRDMVFGIDELVAFISGIMTLEPGDVVLTGTPEGVGPLLDGDTVEVEIDGIGTLQNGVRARG